MIFKAWDVELGKIAVVDDEADSSGDLYGNIRRPHPRFADD